MTPGRRVGRYLLEEVVGTGTFAAVHRAVDERLQDTVAVKVLGDNHAADPGVRERFIAEGRSLRRIDNPHVVRIHDIGEDAGQPFLVLEYAGRGTLAQRVSALRAQGWTPSAADVATFARSLGSAVGAIHQAGLVHRDLSPGNVLVSSAHVLPAARPGPGGGGPASPAVAGPPLPTGLLGRDERLVVADLGLCKDLARSSGLTQAGGTEGFRPPEQRGVLQRVDERADLWALSALIVWLATGAPPGAEDPPGRAAVRAVGLPERLGEVLDVSLADDPELRHPHVEAWLSAVDAALAPRSGATVAAPQMAPEDAAQSTAPSTFRRWGAVRLAVVVAVIAAVVGGAALVASSSGSGSTSVRSQGDGRVEAVRAQGDVRVMIVGPESVTAGEVATFEAGVDNVVRFVWFMPDGAVEVDAPEVQLRAVAAGSAAISLVGVTDSGTRVEATYRFDIEDP